MKQENQDLLNSAVYETPKCEIIEVQNEGVLCASDPQATHDPFTDGGHYGW